MSSEDASVMLVMWMIHCAADSRRPNGCRGWLAAATTASACSFIRRARRRLGEEAIAEWEGEAKEPEPRARVKVPSAPARGSGARRAMPG
jgi:DNA-directed RNA polymerase specialized sigma24 family protein